MWPMIAMMAAMAIKRAAFDKPQEDAQRKQAAETIRNSPWTGLRPGAVSQGNYGNSLLQGAALGASMQGGGMFGGAASGAANPFSGSDINGIGPVANGGSYSNALNNYDASKGGLNPWRSVMDNAKKPSPGFGSY